MTKKDRQEICKSVDYEGFEQIFIHERNFDEIKDEKFHQLVRDYASAHKTLSDYIGFGEYLEKQAQSWQI